MSRAQKRRAVSYFVWLGVATIFFLFILFINEEIEGSAPASMLGRFDLFYSFLLLGVLAVLSLLMAKWERRVGLDIREFRGFVLFAGPLFIVFDFPRTAIFDAYFPLTFILEVVLIVSWIVGMGILTKHHSRDRKLGQFEKAVKLVMVAIVAVVFIAILLLPFLWL